MNGWHKPRPENEYAEAITIHVSSDSGVEFAFAHLEALRAQRWVEYAQSGDHEGDPDHYLHHARIAAAEAQHHISRAVEALQADNDPHLVMLLFGRLFTELETKLDAIRYRAHTPFADQPYWGHDLTFPASATPFEFSEEESDRLVDQSLLFAQQGPDVTAQLPDHLRPVLPDDVDHKIVNVTVESLEPEERIITVRRVTRDD